MRGLTWLVLGVLSGAYGTITPPLGLDLYVPVPRENPLTLDKVALGRQIFSDRRLSADGSTSCASCHDPARAFADPRRVSTGVRGRQGRRHSPSLVNRAYGQSFFWDARVSSLEDLVVLPIEDADELGSSLDDVSVRLRISRSVIVDSLASYVRSIMSGDSRFDRFSAGDVGALSAEERRGLQVFRQKARCGECHIGPNFTDERPHNTGVAWIASTAAGVGEYADLGAGRGDFKTPTLREVAATAPYMHDGSLETLEEVVEFYDRGGRTNPDLDPALRPLGLTVDEKEALAAFLRTLSGSVSR